MSPKISIQLFKSVIRLISLCTLITIASCQKECKPRPSSGTAPFLLKKISNHLTGQNRYIVFKVVRNKKSGDPIPVTDSSLTLRLTRKEGHTAKIKQNETLDSSLKELEDGLFEYPIKEEEIGQLVKDVLYIEIDKGEQKAAFEAELVYNGMFLGTPKKIEFDNKDVRLTLSKLTTKLANDKKDFSFIVKSKGKDLPEEGKLSVLFSRKEGHQASIISNNDQLDLTKVEGDQDTGIFELKLTNAQLGQPITGLSLNLVEGETKAVFDVQLAYNGVRIGSPNKIIWVAKPVKLSIKKVTRDLRGQEKKIKFSIGLKGQQPEELKSNLVLRITRVLDINAKISDEASPSGEASTYEFKIDNSLIGTKELVEGPSIEVQEGDKVAKFKLQLVYNNMDVGKPQFITWRDADIRLEITKLTKKLIGEGEAKRIEFIVVNKGKDLPEKDKITVRVMRLADTNASIDGATEVGSGIYEFKINKDNLGVLLNDLSVVTKEGDKFAKFNLQLFYDGMEIGKPKTVTWKPRDVKLKLVNVTTKLIGQENTDIAFTIQQKDKHEIDASKKLIARLTRKEGHEANILGATTDKGDGLFELELQTTDIGNRIEGLKIEPREGETRAEFSLQIVYNGIENGKPKTIVWEVENPKLMLTDVTQQLRGDTKEIGFTIINKAKEKPEVDDLFLRITRQAGYEAIIEGSNVEDKGDGLFHYKIDINDIGRPFKDLTIQPRQGEMKSVFKLQLVYKGLDIGPAKKVVWLEKDIRLDITKLTKKLQGTNKNIKFIITNKGKDIPEADKLVIRFTRAKGHQAKITTGDLTDGEETGTGFYEFPIGSERLGNEIADFNIIPREGEREAKFAVQLVYDGKELGKPKTITWIDKVIGVSITDLTTALRGHEKEDTKIAFTIHRNSKDDKPENVLEDSKLAIRFIRQTGAAKIVRSEDSAFGSKGGEITQSIFEFPISTTQIGNPIREFMIVPQENEKASVFKIELVYDGKKVGKSKKIKWTTEDIRPILRLIKNRLAGDEEQNRTISFMVKNTGKDRLKETDVLVAKFKRKAGLNSIIETGSRGVTGNASFKQTNEYFEYTLDNNRINVPISDLIITGAAAEDVSEFKVQLFLNGFPVDKPKSIFWENTTLKQLRAKEKAEQKAKEKQEKEEQKRLKEEEKKNKKSEQETANTEDN